MTKNWTTEVEFLLTPKGEFFKAQLKGASGITQFDQASIWAFRDARIFPNPPHEMVQDDGYIHLHYTFNVSLNPSAMAEK
jgi:TonB family protein